MNQARQYSQKPGAIRERTRMTDIETKWRKDRARLLVRVESVDSFFYKKYFYKR